mgnify:FL=1
MCLMDRFIFHKQSTQTSEGKILVNNSFEEITIDIQGTAQSFEAIFERKVDKNSEWTPIMFGNLTDLSLNTKVTELNTNWNNNISGYLYLRVRIINIQEGYLTIVGRLKY